MAKYLSRGGTLLEIEEGKPLRRTAKTLSTLKDHDEVLKGQRVLHVQGGQLKQVQCCGGTNHLLRSRETQEGGGSRI